MPPKRAPQRADSPTKGNNSIPSEICATRFDPAQKKRTFLQTKPICEVKSRIAN